MSLVPWSSETRILTVSAKRSLRSIAALIAREAPQWLVIRRWIAGAREPSFYAFRPEEFLAWARERAIAADAPVEDAARLAEDEASVVTRASSAVEALVTASAAPSARRAVRLDADGRPAAIADPPASTHEAAGTEPGGRHPGEPGDVPFDLGGTRSTRGGPGPTVPSAPEPERPADGGWAGPGSTRSTRGGPTAPSRRMAPPTRSARQPGGSRRADAATVDVTISAEAPGEVRLGARERVDYRIERSDEARPLENRLDGSISVRHDERIRVLLSTYGEALAPRGDRVQEVDPPAPGEPTAGSFDVEALEEGTAELALLFRQGGTTLGSIHLSVTVAAAAPASGPGSAPGSGPARAQIVAEPRDAADDATLVLLIEQRREGDRIHYEYRLHSEALELNYLSLASRPLLDRGGGAAATTQAYVEWIYERVGQEVRNWDDARRLQRGLRTLGMDMCDQLFDPEVNRRLWTVRDRLRMVQVTSWEPYIPWEILRLKDPDTGLADERYLCEYGLVRSLPGEAQPRSLQLRDWRFLAAEYPHGLEHPVGSEVDYFTVTLPGRGVQPRPIEPAYDAFFEALEAGDFDVLHLACHGEASHGRIDDSVLIIGDEIGPNGQPRPIAIDEKTVRHDARLQDRQPIVFLNACSSGRHGISLSAWGGWPTAFLKAGAGAFVGTSWPVREKPAAAFAEAFYDALQQGQALADAAGAARSATKGMGDGSWLAFKVYGHPRARVAAASWPG
jgi:hypothetical protein